jgi:Na+-translocating ferredoxin:NAD+ oxidoreductase subunit G
MKTNTKWSIILILVIVACSVVTGIVYNSLSDKIVENTPKYDNKDTLDIASLIPDADSLKPLDIQGGDEAVKEVNEAYAGDELKGYLIKTDSKGAYSTLSIATAITIDGKISGITILSQKETEGLGDGIVKEDFTNRFKEKDTQNELKVVKEEPKNGDEIQALSSATISSQGVVDGVNAAINYYNAHIKGGE